ncbi:DUF4251 domain-containing protein [Mucilaginibacter sp. HD30]
MKKLLNINYAILICLFCTGTGFAQNTKADKKAAQAAELKRIVEGKKYVFKANSANPTGSSSVQVSGSSIQAGNLASMMGGGSVTLTSTYDLTLSNDTLTAFLPYYGVAYTAPLNPTEGGIKLKTTKFDYKVTEKKKGSMEIVFKPLDLQQRAPADVQRMILTVSAGGYANLQITLLNRQPISFSGTLEEIKPKIDATKPF